jgi:rRNA maturation endonuclease Nob1
VNNFTVTGKVEVTTETTKVKNKLVVENDVEVLNNKITTKDLTSTDTILANNIGTSTSKVTKITARDADIETLSGDDIQQKVKVEGNNVVKVTEDYYDVPVVFVREITAGGRTEHQLQITRINKLN